MNQQQLIEQKAKELQNAIGEDYMSKDWGPHGCNNYELHESVPFNTIEKAFKAGAEWMQGEGERQWISVKDRLPYKDGDSQIFCLVWDTYEGHAVVRPYNEYHKCWDGEDADDFYTDATEGNITHWMPLPPAPPKPQNNENL